MTTNQSLSSSRFQPGTYESNVVIAMPFSTQASAAGLSRRLELFAMVRGGLHVLAFLVLVARCGQNAKRFVDGLPC